MVFVLHVMRNFIFPSAGNVLKLLRVVQLRIGWVRCWASIMLVALIAMNVMHLFLMGNFTFGSVNQLLSQVLFFVVLEWLLICILKCSKDYHRLAGTICCNEWCGLGIEGRCVSLILDSVESGWVRNSEGRKLYHAEHFCCSHVGCGMSLHEFHFVVNRLPWCEKHAHQQQEKKSSGFQSSNNSLARRRTIIIQNVL